MGKNKVLVKVHPEGKYVVDIEKDIDIATLTPGQHVGLSDIVSMLAEVYQQLFNR